MATAEALNIDPFSYQNSITQQTVTNFFAKNLFKSNKYLQYLDLFRQSNFLRLANLFLVKLISRHSRHLSEDRQRAIDDQLLRTYIQIILTKQLRTQNILTTAIFILGYIVIEKIYYQFVSLRKLHTVRFVFDCYKYMTLLLQGIQISDECIRCEVRKIYGTKFLQYLIDDSSAQTVQVTKKNLYFGQQLSFPRNNLPVQSALQPLYQRRTKGLNLRPKVVQPSDQLIKLSSMSKSLDSFKGRQISPKLAGQLGLKSTRFKRRVREFKDFRKLNQQNGQVMKTKKVTLVQTNQTQQVINRAQRLKQKIFNENTRMEIIRKGLNKNTDKFYYSDSDQQIFNELQLITSSKMTALPQVSSFDGQKVERISKQQRIFQPILQPQTNVSLVNKQVFRNSNRLNKVNVKGKQLGKQWSPKDFREVGKEIERMIKHNRMLNFENKIYKNKKV